MAVIVGGKIVFADVRGGPSALKLGDLNDVSIVNPTDGNFLVYNGVTSEWDNRDILAADLPTSGVAAGVYGSATAIPILTVDDKGRITIATTTGITIPQASTTVTGIVELATDAETTAGTDTTRAVTPAGLSAVSANLQPKDSTLSALSGLTTSAGTIIVATGVDEFTTSPVTAYGLSLIDDADATAARTTLGLGTAAVTSVSDYQPINDTLSGLSNLTTSADTIIVATGVDVFSTAPVTTYGLSLLNDADATAARTTLGLGTAATTSASAYQPIDATLTALSGVTTSANTMLVATGVDTFTTTPVSAYGLSLLDDADATTARTTLGLGTAATTSASAYQPIDATLTALSGVTTAANTILVATGADAFTTAPVTTYSLSLMDDVDAAAARTTLGLGTAATQSSTAFQAADATLTGLAAVTTGTNSFIYSTSPDVFTTSTITAFGRSLVDDADATAARTTLGLGTAATTSAGDYQPIDATLTGLSGVTTAANTLIYATGADTFATVPTATFGLSLLDEVSAASTRTTLGITSSGTTNSSSTNVIDTLVLRDNLGNFAAGVITANLTGVASSATKLATARTINGVAFDGTANITVADSTKLPLSGGQITGSLNITGDLSVAGTITGVNRTVSTGDNAILLNSDLTTGMPAQNGGFYVYLGPDTANDAQGVVWNQTSGQWEVQLRTGVVPPPGGTGNIDVGTVVSNFKIWTAGNMGTGSGLDADLLDGNNSGFYTSATNLLTGTLPIGRLPAFTGDITSAAGSNVNTLVTTGVVANTYGSAVTIPVITVDAKGRITSATTGFIPTSSATVSGMVELATSAETTTGTDATRAVTPAGLAAVTATLQPLDATLTGLAGVTTAASTLIYATGIDTFTTTPLTTFGRSLIDDADAATARTTLGLGTAATAASTSFQAADATLTGLAGVTTAANTLIYATGVDTFTTTPVTTYGLSLLDDADAAAARTTLGLGTAATTSASAYQPIDATLTGLAGVTTAANTLIYATGVDTFTTTPVTTYGLSLLDDADAATARTTLGLGTMSTQNANAVALTGTPTAPTAAATTNTTQIATTAYVQTEKTNLNATNLTSGTVPDARISGAYTGITNLTGSGTVTFPVHAGSATDTVTTPSHTWTGDLTTGMYRPAAGQIGFAAAGVQQLTISSSGLTGVGTGLTALNGTNITTGTIAAARVATLNQNTTGSSGSCTGNSATATTLTGLTATVTELNYSVGVTSAIQTQLNAKAPLASPALTGVPTSPTAAVSTNTTQLATTAFTVAQIANDAPTKTGTGASGTWGINVTGNAATATTLQTARTINGVSFNGSANITVTAAPSGGVWDTATRPSILNGSAAQGMNLGSLLVSDAYADVTNVPTNGIWAKGAINTAASITAAGNVTGYSDIRLKTNIDIIPNALNKVCSLRGVTYDRIDTGERQTGLIAQEVQQVLSEAVMEGTDDNKTLSVAYGNMMGLMVEAIKELNAKLEAKDKIIHDLLRRLQ